MSSTPDAHGASALPPPPAPPPPPVEAVIMDLDGLILDTESICMRVARQVLAGHGATLTPEAQRAAVGKRPLCAWRDTAAAVGLTDVPAELLYEQSEPLLAAQWADAKVLPGAGRLLRMLKSCGVKIAVATSTPRATFDKKLSKKRWLLDLFDAVACGDEVDAGKPAPDVFLEAARRVSADPSRCLAFEDAPSGAAAAAAAGMRVVAVPSVLHKGAAAGFAEPDARAAAGLVEVLPSLLAFEPRAYGLPPFSDILPGGVVPLDSPFRIRGQVVKGFGRGSKDLGIPTANVDAAAVSEAVGEAVTGIYAGFASVGASGAVYPAVASIGFNPVFANDEKSCEPWILHDFQGRSFYGEEIRLVICGYVRPERGFSSLEALVARIHEDAAAARAALAAAPLAEFARDEALRPAASASASAAGGGGDGAGAAAGASVEAAAAAAGEPVAATAGV